MSKEKKSWSYYEDEFCCKYYIEKFIIEQSNMGLASFVKMLSLEIKRSSNSIKMKVQNIKQIVIEKNISDSLITSPLKNYSKQNWRIFEKLIKENPNLQQAPDLNTHIDMDFKIENGRLLKYMGNNEQVIIPDEVYSIGGSAFSHWKDMKKLKISDSVTRIGLHAFYGAPNLSSVIIGKGVTFINLNAFGNCRNLTSITVDKDNSVYVSIDGSLYKKEEFSLIQYATGKSESAFTVPNGVISIDSFAFADCDGLKYIVLPDSITIVEFGAFFGCRNLEEIQIGKNTNHISYGAFDRCHNLKSIVVDVDNAIYESINGNLYTKQDITLVQYAIGKTEHFFSAPDNMLSIGPSAFASCDKLHKIELSNNLISIGFFAFADCKSLMNIIIPNNINHIGKEAFRGCDNITIYCEANSKPNGWHDDWNPDNRPVVWGYKQEK